MSQWKGAMRKSMVQASMPYGLLDIQTHQFEFMNEALDGVLERQSLSSGHSVAECLSQLRPAVQRCAQTRKEQTHEWEGTGTCVVFSPVLKANRLLAIQGFALENQNRLAELLASVLASLPVGVWLSKPDGEVYWFNRNSQSHVPGRLVQAQAVYRAAEWMKRVHPDELWPCVSAMATSRKHGRLGPCEFRMKTQAGAMHWVSLEGGPVHQANGAVDCWAGVSVDVERYKQTEAQLREEIALLQQKHLVDSRQLAEVQAELSHVQKIELVGQLAGNVAHDFNNLLFVIGLSASQLSRISEDAHVKRHAELIRQSVAQAARTATGLMAFSGRQPQRLQTYAMPKLLDDVQPLLAQVVGVEVQFSLAQEADLGAVRVDKTQFENAIINLVVNARDALKGRGTVQVLASNTREVHEGHEQAFVCLAVCDNGEGMGAETLARMFEPFFTTKAPGKGTGLGMGMVERFVRQAGGFIKVVSALGEGCTVSVFLPRMAQLDVLDERGAGQAVGGGERIVVLDGDLNVRDSVSQLLGDLGYQVVTAYAPELVLQLMRNGVRPDLILSDTRMQGHITALEMAQQLEDEGMPTPILFMSSYGSDDTMADGRVQGRYPVVLKPVSEEALSHKIREVLASAVV